MSCIPVIVCIAKLESDYIEEWVKYHLALGFSHIFIYDNEDVPTYENQLQEYNDNITVVHAPGNDYPQGPIQYLILHHFVVNFCRHDITHIAHIDIDEFIVLKQHANISDFIQEYITDDYDCAGIGMNWRIFGSSGLTEQTNKPVTESFTMCESMGNKHIKTIFDKRYCTGFNTCHAITPRPGYYTKATNGSIINGPMNENIDLDIIQLNHYKCKTLPEFRRARSRGRADTNIQEVEDVESIFHEYDKNEMSERTACEFYSNLSR
jgi:hypothetical protein